MRPAWDHAQRIVAELPADAVVSLAGTLAEVLGTFHGEDSVSAEAMVLMLEALSARADREGLRASGAS